MSLPRPMRFPTCKLAFETRVGIFCAVLLQSGPKAFSFKKFIHLLPTDMVVLNMDLFHHQELITQRGKMKPPVSLPGQQLSCGERVFFRKFPERSKEFRRRFATQKVLLEKHIFGRARNAPCFDMSATSLAVPVGGWYTFETGAR